MKEGTYYSKYKDRYKAKRLLPQGEAVAPELLPYPAYAPQSVLDYKSYLVTTFIQESKKIIQAS